MFRGNGKLTEEDLKAPMREVRMALLEADVNFKVVKDFVAKVKERAVGEAIGEGLNPHQQIIKIVNEELIELLGGTQSKLTVAPKPPTVIMLVGLQGAGKTTTAGKLANYLKRKHKKPLLVAGDVYRPAAITQLQVLGEQLNVPVFTLGDKVSPVEIAQKAMEKAHSLACDTVIIDTAGRLHIDEQLMDELKRITDRITVMRDGQYVDTLETPTAEISEVIRLMVGRTIYEEPKTKSMCPPDAPVVLEAEHLNSLDVKDVSFKLRKGEILGFAGLVGAGRTETMRLICGADPMDSGTIRVNGKDVKIRSPKDAVRYGIGYLSEDRKRYGLCLNLSVADNTVLPSLEQIFKGPFVHDKKAQRLAQEYAEQIRTKTPSVRARVGSLSGGNQQKVVISKWILRDCDVLIFDEPTRGIDVGAKYEIYELILQLAREGKAVMMVSSEMPELIGICDRILVMSNGHMAGILERGKDFGGVENEQETIMRLAAQYV